MLVLYIDDLVCFWKRPNRKWLAWGYERDDHQQWATRSQLKVFASASESTLKSLLVVVFLLSAVWQERLVAQRIAGMIMNTAVSSLRPFATRRLSMCHCEQTDQFIASWLGAFFCMQITAFEWVCPCFVNKTRASVRFSSSVRSFWLVSTSLRSVYGFGLGFSLR